MELYINHNPTIDRVVQHIINNVTAHECVENNHKHIITEIWYNIIHNSIIHSQVSLSEWGFSYLDLQDFMNMDLLQFRKAKFKPNKHIK